MATSPVHRAYQGESAAARVKVRRDRLLEVAFAQLAVDGAWRTTSIAQLCRDAQLNKRYFYENFSDLDELAGAVVDDLATQLLDTGRAAASAALAARVDTQTLARRVLGAAIGWLAEDPRRAKILFASGADHPRAIAHRRDVVAKLAAGLSAFGLSYHGAKAPLVIAQVGSSMLVGGSIEVILTWLSGGFATPIEELVEDLARLWVAVGDGAIALARERGVKPAKMRMRAPSAPSRSRRPRRS